MGTGAARSPTRSGIRFWACSLLGLVSVLLASAGLSNTSRPTVGLMTVDLIRGELSDKVLEIRAVLALELLLKLLLKLLLAMEAARVLVLTGRASRCSVPPLPPLILDQASMVCAVLA